MKIRSAQPDPDALPYGLKDIQVRATRWGVVVQRNPRTWKRKWTRLQQLHRARFGIAARLASDPGTLDLQTAIEMAKGTEQVPRDILTMAALGEYYIVENDDGTVWRHTDTPTVPLGAKHPPPSLQLSTTTMPPRPEFLEVAPGVVLALALTQ